MDLDLLEATPSWQWPEEAGAVLLRALRNKGGTVRDRLVAAELAGDMVVVNDEIVDALLAVLSDPGEPAELRAGAAIALGPVLETGETEGFDESDPLADVPIAEATFKRIQGTLQRLFHDGGLPVEVRRRILEGSVRASADWHAGAVRAAFHSDDPAWRLTAVFCMRFVHGFDAEIVESLESTEKPVRYEAVLAAGAHGVKDAWPQVVRIVERERSDKPLLLAAIDAVASIRPEEADDVLSVLSGLEDEEIEEAVFEALALAGGDLDDEEDEEDL